MKKDTYSYKGWLVSDKFHKRTLAILGYQAVATLVIYAILFIISIVFYSIAYFLL